MRTGILQQATNARTKTIHANVLEQMQIEASAYTVDKTTGKYLNSLIDYLKEKSIISDISEEDKWLINVTILLGSNQSMGKGTYPNDVYVLEKQDTSIGSIVNTRVATTMPIRIATTNSKKVYNVVYYGNSTGENITLGNLSDSTSESSIDESEKLKKYFNSPDSYDDEGFFIDNDTIGVKVSDLYCIGDDWDGIGVYDYEYYLYNNLVYKVKWKIDSNVEAVTKIDINLSKFGEYTVDESIKILVDPEQKIYRKSIETYHGNIQMGEYIATTIESGYFYLDDEGEEKTFIGYIVRDWDNNIFYYDTSGKIVSGVMINS